MNGLSVQAAYYDPYVLMCIVKFISRGRSFYERSKEGGQMM